MSFLKKISYLHHSHITGKDGWCTR